MTPEQVAVAMPQIEAHVAIGLLAFPAHLIAGRKVPLRKGWQSTAWDLGMLEAALKGRGVFYGLTQSQAIVRRLIILDLDNGAEGLKPGQLDWQDRLDEIVVAHGAIPMTKTTRTPSGGEHSWWVWPDDVPMPGGSWHGFTVRSLWGAKNWVGGPGSATPAGVYVDVWPDEGITTMPWALARSGLKVPETSKALIHVTGGGYTLPDEVEHGSCHLEVCRYTLSLWNKGLSIEEMWLLVLMVLGPRLATPHDEGHLREHFDSATAEIDKFVRPRHGSSGGLTPGSGRFPRRGLTTPFRKGMMVPLRGGITR